MALLEACSLGKRYGSTRVFTDVDLSFGEGELVAVLGVNGAGKTTLLGCLAGLLGWSKGKVLIDGAPFDRENFEHRRKIALLPADGLHFAGTDTIRNAAIFSELWRGIEAPPPIDLEEWLERLGLLEVAFRPLEALSRGQRYKAALLAVHSADPSIWLLDEPFASGMDARGMEAFRRMARDAKGRGRCVVYTTQFPELAARLADRIVILGRGGVLFNETTADHDPGDLIERLAEQLQIEEARS